MRKLIPMLAAVIAALAVAGPAGAATKDDQDLRLGLLAEEDDDHPG